MVALTELRSKECGSEQWSSASGHCALYPGSGGSKRAFSEERHSSIRTKFHPAHEKECFLERARVVTTTHEASIMIQPSKLTDLKGCPPSAEIHLLFKNP